MRFHRESGRAVTAMLIVFLCMIISNTGFSYGKEIGELKSGDLSSSTPNMVQTSIQSNTWTNMTLHMKSGQLPPPRIWHAIAYDSQSYRTILFGGYENGILSDTWAYDLDANAWVNKNPNPHPVPRAFHAMAYDSKSDRIILPYDGNTENKTWAYDFDTNTWTSTNSAIQPPSRWRYAVAYDSKSDRIILFGGYNNNDDTWAYDYNNKTWTSMNPSVHPSSRGDHAMVYDSQSDRIILFGGYDHSNTYLDDTWSYDFDTNTWKDLTTSVRPSVRCDFGMAYDSHTDRIIMFGGETPSSISNETWSYDYNSNTWVNLNPATKPSARRWQTMAYDSRSNRVIIFGGETNKNFTNETWSYNYNTNTWTNMTQVIHPSARFAHAMAYDSHSDRVIMFGGMIEGANNNDETWAYDYNTNLWTNLSSSIRPPARSLHAMAYDSKNDRIIMFGGVDNDTWAYDYNTNIWTSMSPKMRPHARGGHTMAYDSGSNRVMLFGGYYFDGTSHWLDDTWTYDYSTNKWTNITPNVRPSGRYLPAMAYDSRSDCIILFGGLTGKERSDETWAYDYDTNKWTNISPVMKPSVRNAHALIYDSRNDVVVLFGGATAVQNGLNDETWAYDYDTNKWTNMSPSVRPLPRGLHEMAYDNESNRVVLFGGGVPDYNDDTWAYEFDEKPTPPYVVSTTPKNGAVNASLNTNIIITFSETMNNSATEGAISSNPSITGTFLWDITTKSVTWNPSIDLVINTIYTITISNAARSQAGINMISSYTFSFTTFKPPPPHPPFVVSTDPSNGTTNVSTAVKINVVWNEDMNIPSAESAFSSFPVIDCLWVWSGNTQTCTPKSLLQAKTQYFITITVTAQDIVGNHMAEPYSFMFTTEPQSGIIPFVVYTNPPDGAKDVEKTSEITITFSEVMEKPSTEKAIKITPAMQITGIAWDATGKTIMLNAALEEGKTYTVTILKSAKSLVGLAMISDYTFSFTTMSIPPPVSFVNLDLDILVIILIPIIAVILLIALLLMRKKNRCMKCGKTIPKDMDICSECKRDVESSVSDKKPEKPLEPHPSEALERKKRAIEHIRERRRRSKVK